MNKNQQDPMLDDTTKVLNVIINKVQDKYTINSFKKFTQIPEMELMLLLGLVEVKSIAEI